MAMLTVPEIRVHISERAGCIKLGLGPKELEDLLRSMLEQSEKSLVHLDLTLLDDRSMEEANRRHLGCAGPTNVLAFEETGEFSRLGKNDTFARSGSLALAPETVARESFLYGQIPAEHAIRLLAHGLAHLFGYEHGPEMDSVAMTMEKKGLETLRKPG